ncbi:MAG TPA: hypothetical protein VEI02_03460 [Planctomycetota bacterium]|nr:hypothetical protein [Planctomycetota bacterium]
MFQTPRPRLSVAALAVVCASVAVAQGETSVTSAPASRPGADPVTGRLESEKRYQKIGDLPGVHLVSRMSERLLRGAQPDGAEGMESLKKLGVTAILSVEEPDKKETEAAKAAGIRIVNVPTEYSGFSKDVIDRLVAAARSETGTLYTHCHHGKHRGGAATAILRMTFEGFSTDEAIAELAEGGCSKRYPGLFETVKTYRPDPATAHRALTLPGVDDVVEVTPKLFKSSTRLTGEALDAFGRLGVKTLITAGATDAARQAARDRGFVVVDATVSDAGVTADEIAAAWKAVAAASAGKTLVHAGGDPAKASALVAAFRLNFSKWSVEEAAREIEALAASDSGRAQAAAVRKLAR